MRSLLHFGWLATTLAACALGTAVDDVNSPPPEKDAAPQGDAASLVKDASTANDSSAVVDAPSGKDASTPLDSGNPNTTCATPFTGKLATFDFTTEPGNQVSTPAKSTAAGVTAGALGRSSALVATSGLGSINSSNWTISSSVDPTRYYTFTLTPASGCTLDVTSLSITTSASKTGPTAGALATSDDGFKSTSTVAIGGTDTPQVSVSGASGTLEVRVYGYAASAIAGTLRITSTLTVSGSLQ